MAESHPQISRDGIRQWLEQPETRAYLACLEAQIQQRQEYQAKGLFVKPDHDQTITLLHQNIGAVEGVKWALDPETVLDEYGMVKEDAA